MKETTIYIETLLTDKVLEGLESENTPYYIIRYGEKACMSGGAIWRQKQRDPKAITHILLPLKLTTDMVEKEAEKYAALQTHGYNDGEYTKKDFKAAINWLLNLNKEEEK